MRGLATEMAPPFVLVAHFFIASVFFLMVSLGFLPFLFEETGGFFLTPNLASFAHLYLLGFVMMVIFGAMYQLVPVVLEVSVFSKDFAYIQFYMYVVGFVLLVVGLYTPSLTALIPYGAILTYVSMLIFCVNIFLTFGELEEINLVGKYLLVATIFLFISVTLGLFMGLVLGHGLFEINIISWVKAHAVGTLGGFVLMIVSGVALVLIPMFSLAHNFNDMASKIAFYLFCIFVPVSIAGYIFEFSKFLIVFAIFGVAFAVFATIYQLGLILAKRVRKQNDYWFKSLVFSFFSLFFSILVWLATFFVDIFRLPIVAGFLFCFGFLFPFIVGHIYKILPFLVWYDKFSPLVGKQKVPMLHDMIHANVADFQFWSMGFAVFAMLIGIVFQIYIVFVIGAIVMIFSGGLVLYNVYYTFTYKIKE
ncbi:MAG: hypothetical protein PHN38_07215 [Sulfurospirillaceae bacterium]|nr:hypothetical protein [Sulfurospirillaceae bacterium]MDD3463827.1 hypothetical protein [Sulfurospirillaceae bacterium]